MRISFLRIAMLLGCAASLALAQSARYPAKSQPQNNPSRGSSQPNPALSGEKKVEAYLRDLFAWGPEFQVSVGPFRDAVMPGFYQVPVHVTASGQTETGIVYLSKDGRFLLRGEIRELDKDPFAGNRAKLRVGGSPSKGPADAAVTVVEFSDFQCPHCRQLYEALKDIESRHPQVRFIFKNYPLTKIHPWAMTAALAARCAYQHSVESFWKVHDTIFDNQDSLNAENVWEKVQEFDAASGVDSASFRACMAAPETKDAISGEISEAQALNVESTPTVFVNGRVIVGPDPNLISQFLEYELHHASVSN